MYLRFPIVCFVLICAAQLSAQTVQWASSVLSCSLPMNHGDYSTTQILGRPNVLPATEHSRCAWVIAELDDHGKLVKPSGTQSITLAFESPMRIQQVAVAESYNPGAVQRITLIDSTDGTHVMYEGNARAPGSAGRMLNVFFPMTTIPIRAVTLDLQPERIKGLNEIDAVGISDGSDSIRATIHLAEELTFGGIAEPLGAGVNTSYSEYVPVVTPDGKTLYFARNNDPANIGGPLESGNTDIWVSELESDGKWGVATNIGRPINNTASNAIFSISSDGRTMLLKGRYLADASWGGKGLSLVHLLPSGWSMPDALAIKNYYNRSDYSEACIGNDECTVILAVERDDTFGDKDLYVSKCAPDGTWDEPKNLGPEINTSGNESSPFLAADGVTLYFSTDGRSGYGGKDIYRTRRLDSSWTHWSEPENLGPAINTPGIDAYYFIDPADNYAYFSREVGDNGNTDLFRIALHEISPMQPVIRRSNPQTTTAHSQQVIASKTFQALPPGVNNAADQARRAAVRLGIVAPSPDTTQRGITGVTGNTVPIKISSDHVAATDTVPVLDSTRRTEPPVTIREELSRAVVAPGHVVRLNNIFFAFNSAELNTESFAELDSVVNLLQWNKEIGIQVIGHTDNIGSVASNMRLSNDRAKAVMAYFIGKGIAASRLAAKGAGKSMPVAENDTEEARRMNRRVEFTIVQ